MWFAFLSSYFDTRSPLSFGGVISCGPGESLNVYSFTIDQTWPFISLGIVICSEIGIWNKPGQLQFSPRFFLFVCWRHFSEIQRWPLIVGGNMRPWRLCWSSPNPVVAESSHNPFQFEVIWVVFLSLETKRIPTNAIIMI